MYEAWSTTPSDSFALQDMLRWEIAFLSCGWSTFVKSAHGEAERKLKSHITKITCDVEVSTMFFFVVGFWGFLILEIAQGWNEKNIQECKYCRDVLGISSEGLHEWLVCMREGKCDDWEKRGKMRKEKRAHSSRRKRMVIEKWENEEKWEKKKGLTLLASPVVDLARGERGRQIARYLKKWFQYCNKKLF